MYTDLSPSVAIFTEKLIFSFGATHFIEFQLSKHVHVHEL